MRLSLLRGGLPPAATLGAAALAFLAALPASALGPPAAALVSVHEAGIDFVPGADYSRAVLEVSGPEVEQRRVFAAGRKPAIGRYDSGGQRLPDGTYTWRLSLVPDAAAARALRDAAGMERGEAPGAWQAETGSFTIVDGSFVDPGLVEPTERRSKSEQPTRETAADARSSRGAGDSDASVAAGSCEDDAVHANDATPAPFGAGLAAPDAKAGADSDAALLDGAEAERGPFGPAPAVKAAAASGTIDDAERANGRDPAARENR